MINSGEIKIEIQKYVKTYILRKKEDLKYNETAVFKMKSSNFSNEVSENLVRILIEERDILTDYPDPIYSLKRPNNNDIIINDTHKIEVKGTTSSDGLITLSKNNLKCYAWVWVDFHDVVNEVSEFVDVHVVKRPEMNITPKCIPTNGEQKLNIRKLCRDIKDGSDYELFHYNLNEFRMCKRGDTFNDFFVME